MPSATKADMKGSEKGSEVHLQLSLEKAVEVRCFSVCLG